SHYREELVDFTIRSTLDQYREILQPKKMEQLYEEIPKLSRNIARFLPHEDLTWKEAESEFEKQFLEQALQDNNWNVGDTAKKIKIRAETLSRKIKKLALKK
ncbi:MAG: helix-turn-helix domain-containing protein, partial [Candidatus Woesearchaeota archaeon]